MTDVDLADSIERYRAKWQDSNRPFGRCASEMQLDFAAHLGRTLPRFLTVWEAYEDLRYFLSTTKELPPTADPRKGKSRELLLRLNHQLAHEALDPE